MARSLPAKSMKMSLENEFETRDIQRTVQELSQDFLPEGVGFLMIIFAGDLKNGMGARRVGIERTFPVVSTYETFVDHCTESLQISQGCLRHANDVDVMLAIFTHE